jgi:hypothetical protein
VLGDAQEESANKDTVVAQNQGINPPPLVFWSMLMARTNRPKCRSWRSYTANSSSNAFASFRSRVSNPSVNQP